jgi:hypothetical protein
MFGNRLRDSFFFLAFSSVVGPKIIALVIERRRRRQQLRMHRCVRACMVGGHLDIQYTRPLTPFGVGDPERVLIIPF